MSSSGAVSDLTSHLGYWLRYVSNHVSQGFARRLSAKGVTVAEWAMMRTLYAYASVPPSRLAEEMGMTRGAITKLADRLIAKGLVVRKASPADGRAQTLGLTTKGKGFVPRLAAVADQNDAAFFDHLTMEERGTLKRVLQEIVEREGLSSIPID